jgi:hypothetical protein
MTAKKKGAIEMSLEITIRHIRALAGKRSYRVIVEDSHIHVIKKCDEQIRRSFDLHEPFEIDPPSTGQFTFMRIYCWMRGYELTSKEQATVRIERAMHHPKWNRRQPCEKQFAYQGLFHFLSEIASWIQYLETHHCPFLERLSLQEEIPTAPSSHDMLLNADREENPVQLDPVRAQGFSL